MTQDAKALAKPFELRTATHIVHCDWHCEDVKRQAGFILEISMNAYNRKVMDVCQNCGAALKAALESQPQSRLLIEENTLQNLEVWCAVCQENMLNLTGDNDVKGWYRCKSRKHEVVIALKASPTASEAEAKA